MTLPASQHPRAPRPAIRRTLLAVALLAATAAFAADERAASPGATIDPAHWPQPSWPLPADAALEQKIDALMATMTVEEKVGQTIQGDISTITPADLRKYRLGSILAGGGSSPPP